MLMGWIEQDVKKSHIDRLAEAIAHYQKKYGVTPLYCEVHQSLGNLPYPGIEIAPKQSVYTPNLFYIGIRDD